MGKLHMLMEFPMQKPEETCSILEKNYPSQKSFICAGAWLWERLRRWLNKPDVVGSIPVTTEFFLNFMRF